MEVKKIKDEEGFLMLELERESKTFTNLLSEELWNDKNVSTEVIPKNERKE